MKRVYLSIGSNINKHFNVAGSIAALKKVFGELRVSRIYESEPVGFPGDNFYNLVVGFDSALLVGDIGIHCKRIEDEFGRRRGQEKLFGVTLDIDVLTVGSAVGTIDGVVLPRGEIVENAFVLWPLAEIAPEECHPIENKTYAALWQAYDREQVLWPLEL